MYRHLKLLEVLENKYIFYATVPCTQSNLIVSIADLVLNLTHHHPSGSQVEDLPPKASELKYTLSEFLYCLLLVHFPYSLQYSTCRYLIQPCFSIFALHGHFSNLRTVGDRYYYFSLSLKYVSYSSLF